MQNPMDQIQKLLEAIDAAISDIEFSRATPGVALIPSGDANSPNTIGITFKLNGDILLSPEQRRVNSEFDQLISNMEQNEASESKLADLLSDWDGEEWEQ